MLTGIELKNFKCFEKIKIPELKNISILTGINNVGKSTIMQAIIFLKESISNDRFSWDHPDLNLINYKTTVYKHEIKRNIEIACTFSLNESDKEQIRDFSNNLDDVTYSITIDKNSKILKEIFSTGKNIELLTLISEGKQHIFTLKKSKYIPIESDIEMRFSSYTEYTPLGWILAIDKNIPDPYLFVEKLKQIIIQKFQSIYYLTPNRNIPELYSNPNTDPVNVGYKGQNTSVKLHYIFSDRDKVFEEIEDWLKKFDPEITMLRTPLVNGQATIEFETYLGLVNLLTSGYGINALFPIIVQSFSSNPYSTILIEEPEIHLHTGAQKVVMDMFTELVTENKQFILTTHSYDILMDCYEKVRDKIIDKTDIIRWDIKRKEDFSRYVEKTDVYKYEWSGHGGWRDDVKHLTERPVLKATS